MAAVGRVACLAVVVILATTGRAGADVCISAGVRFAGLKPEPGFVREMQREVSSIWRPYGVQVQWDDAPAACDRIEGSFDVVIARRLETVMKGGEPVLASTNIPLATIDHLPVRVDYDAVERHLRSVPQDRLKTLIGYPEPGSVEIGRAVGRVLAHEIGHVLLAAPSHQTRGLMRPAFTPADLIGHERRRFTLSTAEQHRLQNREEALRVSAAIAAGFRPSS